MFERTCPRCNCAYSLSWGQHYCLADLPDLPKEFREVNRLPDGSTLPKRDYWDRKAWLAFHARPHEFPDGWDWQLQANLYRAEAEERAQRAKAEEALRGAMA